MQILFQLKLIHLISFYIHVNWTSYCDCYISNCIRTIICRLKNFLKTPQESVFNARSIIMWFLLCLQSKSFDSIFDYYPFQTFPHTDNSLLTLKTLLACWYINQWGTDACEEKENVGTSKNYMGGRHLGYCLLHQLISHLKH